MTLAPWLIALNSLCVADASMTHYAITQRHATEMVLPTNNPWTIDGLVAGEAVATNLGLTKLEKAHPRVALTMAIGLTALRGYAVAHNLRELHR